MAFQDVRSQVGGSRKATELAVGEEIIGYVTGFEENRMNPESKNLLMRGEDGTSFRLFTAGNLKYLINDGVVKTGILTKIVRLEDKNIKGKNSSQFQVLQDSESTLDEALFAEIGEQPAKTAAPAAPAKAAAPATSSVKTRAEALARSVANSKRA